VVSRSCTCKRSREIVDHLSFHCFGQGCGFQFSSFLGSNGLWPDEWWNCCLVGEVRFVATAM
jgi:hypothetical protein